MQYSRFLFGRSKLGILVAQREAAQHSGACLSTDYSTSKDPLRWQCSSGHEWEASLSSVRIAGTWCPHCFRIRQTLDLPSAVRLAASKGGLCLSESYVDARTKLRWQCARGHQWDATWDSVNNRKSWCPTCALDSRRIRIDDAIKFAESRGGLCLTKNFYSRHQELHWRCNQGHEWFASWQKMKNRRHWCRHCYWDRVRLRLSVAIQVAKSHGGLCLSKTYVNCKTPLQWRCANGHEWSVAINHLLYSNSWCPTCASGRSEREIRQILETIFSGRTFPKCRPCFLPGLCGRRLELDGYCSALRLAFEYNGEQHYLPGSFFNRTKTGNYAALVARDRLKVERCQAAGVRVVIVPFWVKDRWTFVRCFLLRWFSVSDIFPVLLAV